MARAPGRGPYHCEAPYCEGAREHPIQDAAGDGESRGESYSTMDDGLLTARRDNLRIFRGGETVSKMGSEGTTAQINPSLADLQQPPKLSSQETASQLLASINFAARETKATAPSGAGIHEIINALNSRWCALTGRAELMSEQALKNLLQMSPVFLQEATGENLVFQAAISIDTTPNKTFKEQMGILKGEGFHVASPASAAVVMAGLLVKAFEQYKSSFIDHLGTVAFRVQALDPMTQQALPEHHVIVRYDHERGIVAEKRNPTDRSTTLWCAGSSASHDRPVPTKSWLESLFS